MKSETLPAPLIALVQATGLYQLEVSGNALAPRYCDGDFAIIRPAVGVKPESIMSGSIVLVALADPSLPNLFQRTGLFTLNRDGDLTAGTATVEKDKYLILGVASERGGIN